jgi:phosphoglycerol transferase
MRPLAERWLRGERRGDLVAGFAVVVISLLAVVLVMRLWRADFGVPFLYTGDANLFLMLIKGALNHGWYVSNPDLGAPFGQHNQDFPTASGDTIHLLIVKFLGLFTGNVAAVVNLYFLLGFLITGAVAFAAFRALEVSRPPAAVCAVLFTLLPFHFVVGEAQPFNSAYWLIPIACYLALAVLADRPLFVRARRPVSRALAFASRRTLATLALCVVIGSAGNYYASYAALLIAVVALLALLPTRSARPLLAGAVVSVAILATVGLNALPTILYRHEHGSNPTVAKRRAGESELYSLSVAAMVLPIPDHRLSPLANLRDRYERDSPLPTSAGGPALGLVPTIGFLWLIGFALAAVVGAVPGFGRRSMHGCAAAATLVAVLIGTTGGFSVIFAHLISAQLRVWERYYLFIAFFALLAVALLLEAAVRRIGSNPRRGYLAPLLLGAVVAFGVFDQTGTSTTYLPDYSATEAQYSSDGEIVSAIERRLPPGSSVFQLPYVGYPEAPTPGRTAQYDQARPYIHSEGLRWSYGAMEDRADDWSAALADKPLGLVLPAVSAAGFDGVLVDRLAYGDRAAALESELGRTLRAQPLVSTDRRFAFYDTRAYGKRLQRGRPTGELAALRSATLHPLVVAPGDDLARYVPDGTAFDGSFALGAPEAALSIANPSAHRRAALLELRLERTSDVALRVELPGGPTRTLRAGRTIRARLALAPGSSQVRLSVIRSTAGVPVVVGTELLDSAQGPFLGDIRAAPSNPQETGFAHEPAGFTTTPIGSG